MKRLISISIALVFVLSACQALKTDVSDTKKTNGDTNTLVSKVEKGTKTQNVGEGIEKIVHYFDTESTAKVILYKIPKNGFDWKIHVNKEPLFLSSWYDILDEKPLVISNGVYFDENMNPTGLIIENGKKVSKSQYDTARSGFVSLSPTFAISDTNTEPLQTSGVLFGMQSYPFLLTNGKKAIEEDSGKTAQRTFIATDTTGNRYIGVLFEKSLSLFELTNVLLETDIDWDMVLNLDGGTSTGLYSVIGDTSEYLPSLVPIPNVITVEKK